MPRTDHVAQEPLGPYGDYSVGNAADYTYQAATGSSGDSGEKTLLTGKELLLVRNADGAGAHALTITSVNDAFGRQEHIAAYNLGISEFAMFGPFKTPGWKQTDGYLYFEADNVNIEFAVIKLP